jgi:hypothetical protein
MQETVYTAIITSKAMNIPEGHANLELHNEEKQCVIQCVRKVAVHLGYGT